LLCEEKKHLQNKKEENVGPSSIKGDRKFSNYKSIYKAETQSNVPNSVIDTNEI
jgi:hypothetical protein